AGERIGDVGKVLPACRQLLHDGVSQVRGALNYMLILTFVITPFSVFVPVFLNIFVIPKFKEVFEGMMPGNNLPAFTRLYFGLNTTFVWTQVAFVTILWLLLLAYV